MLVMCSSVAMDLQLKRIQEVRRNDCKRIMHYINSVDFTSLEDKEIRTLVMIRELGNGIVNRQRKLVRVSGPYRILFLFCWSCWLFLWPAVLMNFAGY